MRILELFGRRAPEPSLRWVGQEEGKGCAVACTAMLLGQTYWSARTLFPHFDPEEGVLPADVIRVLGEYGWASVEKFAHYSPERRDRRVWPLPPFAPVHLCQVISTGWHAVLMTTSGAVLDPLYPPVVHGPRTLADYPRVLSITGLWRIS